MVGRTTSAEVTSAGATGTAKCTRSGLTEETEVDDGEAATSSGPMAPAPYDDGFRDDRRRRLLLLLELLLRVATLLLPVLEDTSALRILKWTTEDRRLRRLAQMGEDGSPAGVDGVGDAKEANGLIMAARAFLTTSMASGVLPMSRK